MLIPRLRPNRQAQLSPARDFTGRLPLRDNEKHHQLLLVSSPSVYSPRSPSHHSHSILHSTSTSFSNRINQKEVMTFWVGWALWQKLSAVRQSLNGRDQSHMLTSRLIGAGISYREAKPLHLGKTIVLIVLADTRTHLRLLRARIQQVEGTPVRRIGGASERGSRDASYARPG